VHQFFGIKGAFQRRVVEVREAAMKKTWSYAAVGLNDSRYPRHIAPRCDMLTLAAQGGEIVSDPAELVRALGDKAGCNFGCPVADELFNCVLQLWEFAP
jgi:hypothetical protein